MKREILFRGKAVSNGEWIEGQLHTYGDGVFICQTELMSNGGKDFRVPGIEVDPETVEQFTGVVDKNGKQIFEGDIISSNNHSMYGGKYIVQWDEEFTQWCTKLPLVTAVPLYSHATPEIIGNIHDNPEVLKKSSNHLQM